MHFLDLKNILSKGEISPVYLFWVEDSFALDQSLQSLRDALAKKHPGYEEIHWNPEKGINLLLEELGSFSFFAKHKFIRMDGDDFCCEEDLTKLSTALENNTLSTLVFVPKKKTAFNQAAKILKNITVQVECSKPRPKDLGSFVLNFAKAESKQMAGLAARKLIEYIGMYYIKFPSFQPQQLLSRKNQFHQTPT